MILNRHPRLLPYLALASVCFLWGTTYVTIRIAIETIPPFLLVGSRFTASGLVLLIVARLARFPMPSRRDLALTAVFGIMALGIGNSALSTAELWVPSGLAALLVTTSPFWMIGLEAVRPGGEKLHLPAVAGLLVGLAGTAVLVGPDAWRGGLSGGVMKGFLVLQIGCVSWSLSSIGQRHRVGHINVVVSGAIQQLASGLVVLALALALGQRPTEWTVRGIGAVAYLSVFGSIVGYTSYVYALQRLPVALVTIYNYVNPVVAAILGWIFFREAFGVRQAMGMGVIFLGVAVVKHFGATARTASPPLREPIPSPEPSPPSPRPGSAEE